MDETTCMEPASLIPVIGEFVKRGGAQGEKGEKTGYLHHQGRVSFLKKRYKHGLLQLFKDTIFSTAHWTVTSKSQSRGDNFTSYVTKEHTRIKPYVSFCKKKEDKDRAYIPSHISLFSKKESLWPY